MRFSLLPDLITDRLTDLSPYDLQKQGIHLLMLDFDNTIVPYTTDVPAKEMADWLRDAAGSGIFVCIVSNSHRNRVPYFCAQFGLDCITHARKPFSVGIRRCLERYGVSPHNAVLVGDQIFTDTLGANCCGVRSVLVKAIDNHTFWLKLRHVAEMPFILLAGKRRLVK